MQKTLHKAAVSDTGPKHYTQQQMDQFAEAHERFARRQLRGHRAIWRFLQLQDMDFGNRLLCDADITGSNLQRARLVRTDLQRASLFCADLSDVDARGADLRRADIRGVSLRHANLAGANLNDADLRQAVLARTSATGGFQLIGRSATAGRHGGEPNFSVDFSNASLKGAKLQSAKMARADFSGALLNGADLSGANLEGANFDGAVLIDTKTTNARLSKYALLNCVLNPTPEAITQAGVLIGRLDEADRWYATNAAEGRGAVLDGEDLRPLGAIFEQRRLTAMSAKRTLAVGVSFKGAQLQGACFDDADLRDADFTRADLRGASFRGANLHHARFDDADMRPLPLSTGGFRAVDFEDADFASKPNARAEPPPA